MGLHVNARCEVVVQSFSSCHKQLSVALLKPLYLNWDFISFVHKLFARFPMAK